MIKLLTMLNEIKSEVRLDQILDKINKDGMKSLTFKEKTFLKDYSQNKTSDIGDVKILPFNTESLIHSAQIIVYPNISNVSFDLETKLIKDILEKNNIDAEIGYLLMLGMVNGLFIKLEHNFNNKKVINIMNEKGFSCEENPFYSSSPETHTNRTSKTFEKVENSKPNIIVSLNSSIIKKLNLSIQQNMEKLSKLLRKNNITSFILLTNKDKNEINIDINKSDNKTINDINSLLRKNGYDTTIVKQ